MIQTMTNERENRIREYKELMEMGFRYSDIAKKYEVSRQAIECFCKRYGIQKKPFMNEFDLLPGKNTQLRQLNKPYCNSCYAIDIPLMKHSFTHNKQYYKCRPCNAASQRKYYSTTNGKKSMQESKKKYYEKLKNNTTK